MNRFLNSATAILLMGGCTDSTTPAQGVGQTLQASQAPLAPQQKLDKWSWLPNSTKRDAELAPVPKESKVALFIPKQEPLTAKSGDGWGNLDSGGNFVPTDRQSYQVTGGALVSKLGPVEKKAIWGDWDFAYSDPGRKEQAGWGHCLTSGELLLSRERFLDQPANVFVSNSFAIESYGDAHVLITLDQAKGHKFCFVNIAGSTVPTGDTIHRT